jgi:microsomal epoxide hydrolase
MAYNLLPTSAKGADIRPFTVDIPDSELERMKTLLKLSNVASSCYENSLPDGSRRFGLRREWLVKAKEVWETNFNWCVPSSFPRQHQNLTSTGNHTSGQ